jgi:hypothetical protein
MKNRKLLVRPSCCKRGFYLSRRSGSSIWEVKFTPPRWSFARTKFGKKRIVKSTGTSEIETAKVIAGNIINSFWKVNQEDGAAARNGLTVQNEFAALTAIEERYKPEARDVDPVTAKRNLNSLKLVIREGAGVEWANGTALLLANADAIKNFQKRRLKAVADEDLETQESAAVTINSTVTMAKAVVAKKHMDLFKGLSLPNLTEFRECSRLKVDADMSFVPFAPGMIERIEAEMLSQPRNVFLTCLLMLRLGMRNKDVQFAKWEWFKRWPTSEGVIGMVEIRRRPYYKPKNRSVRAIQLDAKLVAELAPYWGADDEWVIDAPDRHKPTHREINDWLRTIIPDRTKCAYELRKHAGSMVWTEHGAEAAAAFLGDTVNTAEKYYAKYLRPIYAVKAAASTSLSSSPNELVA